MLTVFVKLLIVEATLIDCPIVELPLVVLGSRTSDDNRASDSGTFGS